MANFFDQFDEQPKETNFFDQFDEKPVAPPVKQAGFSLGDIAKSFGIGAAGSTKALTDVAGAENLLSSKLGKGVEGLQQSLTPERQAEMERQAARMKAAEESGSLLQEIKAGALNVAEAPLQSAAQAIGSFVPYLPALFAAPVAAAMRLSVGSQAAIRAVAQQAPKVIGTAQGAGAIKGSIYDGVLQAEMEAGVDPEIARQKADTAQSYFGGNFDQIALGAGLGLAAGSTGVEKFFTPVGRAGLAPGIAQRVAGATLAESLPEAAQGGQERLAQNIALQREGYDVDTFKGVAGAATQEALTGALGAAPIAALVKPEVKPSEALTQVQDERDQFAKEFGEGTPVDAPAPVAAVELPGGFTVTQRELSREEVPESFGIFAEGSDKPLTTVSTQADIDAKIATLTEIRAEESARLEKESLAIDESILAERRKVDVMEATGQTDTDEYVQAKALLAQKEVTAGEQKEQLIEKIKSYLAPLSFAPIGQKTNIQSDFVATRGEEVIGSYPTFEEAEATLRAAEPEVFKQADMEAEALRAQADATRLDELLRPLITKFNLGDVGLNIVDKIANNAGGSYLDRLIEISMDEPKPIQTMRHESMHALRDLEFFTPQQWNALTERANKQWIKEYLEDQTAEIEVDGKMQTMSRLEAYKKLGYSQEAIIEEAVADAFGAYERGVKPPPGLIAALFKKLQNFFKNFGQALRGAGFESSEDIFERVERGELKSRKPKAEPKAKPAEAEEKLSLTPKGIPQKIFDLHEKLLQAEDEATGRAARTKGIAPGAAKRNQTMAFRRLNSAVMEFVGNDEQKALDLMVKMNEESSKRGGEKYSLAGAGVPRSTRNIMESASKFAQAELGLNTEKIKGKSGVNNVRDVGKQLNRYTLEQFGGIKKDSPTAKEVADLAEAVVDEVGYQLRVTAKTGTGTGWYSNNYPNALKKLGKVFPELSDNPLARSVFSSIVAVTSNGEDVSSNIKSAIRYYQDFRDGKPMVATGSRRPTALENNLSQIEKLFKEHGENFTQELTKEITVAELNAYLRSKGEEPSSDYLKETKVPAAAIYFGPKLGAFFANLSGSEGYLTMDLWWTRSINRMRGMLIPKATESSINAFRDLMDQPSATREEVIAAIVPFKQKYENHGYTTELEFLAKAKEPRTNAGRPKWLLKARRKAGPAFDQLMLEHKLEKMANTIYKNEFEMLEEAPFNASDRKFMYDVARSAQKILKSEGVDLSLADIQAALWYYEKRLYAKLTGREADDIGYEEAIIARASDNDRREGPSVVFDKQPDRRDDAGREGRLPDETGGQLDGTKERLKDETNEATRPDQSAVRPSGRGNEKRKGGAKYSLRSELRTYRTGDDAPQTHTQRSGGDVGRLRVLGAKPIAQYIPADLFKGVVGQYGHQSPNFYEISGKDADAFESAIQASKNASRFGASVFVYSVEDYAKMRLFLTEDGKSGFALKDDDIVSVFSGPPHKGSVYSSIQLAVQEGGRKLDAFDTVLGDIYNTNGFQVVGRMKWNEDYKPDNWNKTTFAKFNGGEPDVVYMSYDPDDNRTISENPGKYFDDPNELAQAQKDAVNKYVKEGTGYGSAQQAEASRRLKTQTGTVSRQGGVRRGVQLLDEQTRAKYPGLEEPVKGLPATVKVDGVDVTFGPYIPAREAAVLYAEESGLPYRQQANYHKLDPEFSKMLASSYARMIDEPNAPQVKAAYKAWANETIAQYKAMLKTGITVEFFPDAIDTYSNPRNAILDVLNNNHLYVFPADGGFGKDAITDEQIKNNPALALTDIIISGRRARVVEVFRATHDFYGHIKEGFGFRAEGEENAFQSHVRMYSPLAARAMTAGTRGQNSEVNYGPNADFNKTASGKDTKYADQKIGLLPEWASTMEIEPDITADPASVVTGKGVVLGTLQPDAISVNGAHYGLARVSELDASKYGTGLRGAERRRLEQTDDERIKRRAYFYIAKPDGSTPIPESGVGQYVYTQKFDNILGSGPTMSRLFREANGDSNNFESLIVDVGYDGYAVPSMGMMVILNNNVPVNYVGPRSEVGVKKLSLKNVAFPSVRAVKEAVSATEVPKTDAFKRFIAGNQWTDADGNPKVFYHATAREFFEFTPAGQSQAIFLAETPEEAETFGSIAEDRLRREIYRALTKDEKLDFFQRVIDAQEKKGSITAKQGTEFMRQAKRKIPVYGDFGDIEQETYDAMLDLSPTRMSIMPLYARAETPFEFQNPEHVEQVMQWVANNTEYPQDFPDKWLSGLKGRISQGLWQAIEDKRVQQAIRTLGFDAFTVREGRNSPKNYAVYQPEQVKSVTGNIDGYGREIKDIRFSLPTLPTNIYDRVNETTTTRERKGFAQRMIEAISPQSAASFRAKFLNRYNQLSVYDKKLAEQMGGAALLADQSAESAALFSDVGAGIAASAMGTGDRNGGIPVLRNGVTTIDTSVKGLVASLAPLARYNDPVVYQLYQYWAMVKRGQRLDKQGKPTGITTADVAYAKTLEAKFPEFVSVQKDLIAFNNGLVKYMVDTGVLSKERGAEYTKYADYVPFYRQMDGENTIGPNLFQSLSGVKPPKKLKGKDVTEAPLADFLETMVRNTQSAIQAGIKNYAGQRAINVAAQVTAPGMGVTRLKATSTAPDVINVLEKGELVSYATADTLLIEAVKSLNLSDLPFMGILSAPADLLRNLVTKDPGFMMANLLRDSLSAYVTSGVKMTPVVDTVMSFGKSLTRNSPTFEALLNAGIISGYDSGNIEKSGLNLEKDLAKKAGAKDALLLRPFTSLWDALEKGTTASDAATRVVIYERIMAETGNEAEALFRSLEVMNFHRKGSSSLIRVLTAAVPFFNARLQGLDLFYRASTGNMNNKDAAAIQRQFFVRGMTMMALSAAYWFMVSDDEEYKKQEQETKDNNWLIPALGIRIPIPFEVGVLFKTIPERIAAYTFGNDTGQDLRDALFRNAVSTFAFNPIFQTVKPLVEAAFNVNTFTFRPIVSEGMQDVDPQYQVGPGTSSVAKGIAGVLGLSPMKVDHVIKGYTGTLGMYGVDTLDMVMDQFGDSPRATKRFEQLPIIKRFALDPEARGNVTEYYKLKDSVDSVVRTMNFLEKQGESEEYVDYLKKNQGTFAFKDYIRDTEKTMKELRQMKSAVQISKMSGDEKRDAITGINRAENAINAEIQRIKTIISSAQ